MDDNQAQQTLATAGAVHSGQASNTAEDVGGTPILKRKYSSKTLKVLFALSGNRCAEPDCHEKVIKISTAYSDAIVVAQIAHIYALSADGPRGKKGLTEAELNAPRNLILLCPTHHVIVDGQHETYPASTLFDWKVRQEREASRPLTRSITEIGYPELDIAAKALTTNKAISAPNDLVIVAPKDKIEINALGSSSEMLISMGLAKSHEVGQVLIQADQLNPGFPDRLRAGFVEHYKVARASGLRGDDLFFDMYDWSGAGSKDPARVAAGLCVLTHLFIVCDVFEK